MSYQSNLFYFKVIFFIIQLNIINSFKCEKDGFFADKRDCWVYHICVGRTHTIKSCTEDLLFNPITNQCDWAINVNCTTDTVENVNLTNNFHIFTNNNKSIFDDLCLLIDNDYIAHPNDCKQYAYCANGIPQTKICKKTLLWSQTEKMCVWPAQSDCPVKNTTPIPSTTRDSSRISQTTTFPLLSFHQSSIICPPNLSWRVPDPYDCSIYHDCYHGTDLITQCSADLQYNHEKQICDYAQNVQCKNKCTLENEGARFIDSTSCCHYYECKSGKLILQVCLQPNLFDIQTRKCLPYKQVKCDGRRQCLTKCHYDLRKNLCDVVSICTGHSDGFYLDRNKPNCQSYIQCIDNRVVSQNRCSFGQRFNRNTGRCISADQVACFALLSKQISWMIFILSIVSNIILLRLF